MQKTWWSPVVGFDLGCARVKWMLFMPFLVLPSFSFNFYSIFVLNSQAVGMAIARPYGFQIDFVRIPISLSTA